MGLPVESLIARSKRAHPFHREYVYVGRMVPRPDVAGHALLRFDAVRRALGPAALALWREMLAWRDGSRDRLAFPTDRRTVGRLARDAGLTPRQVRSANRKLYRLGLVEHVGPGLGAQFMAVPTDRAAMRQRFSRVFVREVVGAEVLRERPGMAAEQAFTAPRQVADRIYAERGRGGARPGSGPKPRTYSNVSATRAGPIQTCPPKKPKEKTQVREGAEAPSSGQRGWPPGRAGCTVPNLPVPSSANPCTPGPEAIVDERVEVRKPAQPSTALTAPRASTCSSAPPGLGTLLGPPPVGSIAAPARPLAERLRRAGAPRRPTLVQQTCPPARLIPEDADDREVTHCVVAGYVAGVGAYGHDVSAVRFAAGPGGGMKAKARGSVVAAGRMLQHRGIAPVAWAAFAQRWWADRNGDSPIPLKVAFSVGLVDSMGDRFDDPCAGGTVVMGATWRLLLRTHKALEHSLLTGLDAEDADRAAVLLHFPPGRHERLVSQAQAEEDAEVAELDLLLRRGEWLPYWRK